MGKILSLNNASNNIDKLFNSALNLYKKGNNLEAEKIINKLIILQLKNSRNYFLKGLISLQLKDHQGAIQAFNKVNELNPLDISAYIYKSIASRLSGNFSLALDTLKNALNIDPNNSLVYLQLGLLSKISGNHQEALHYFEVSIHHDLNQVEAHFNKGVILHLTGQLLQAEISYNKVIEKEPNHLDALSNLGVIFKNTAKIEKSIEVYNRILLIKPNYAQAYANRGLSYHELMQYELALKDHEKAITLDPLNARPFMNMGLTYYKLRKFNLAIQYFDKALEIDSSVPELLINKGLALQALGNLDQAIDYYNESIKNFPNNCLSYVNIAEALNKCSRLHEASEMYQKAISINPKHRFLRGNHFMHNLKMCNWNNYDFLRSQIIEAVKNGETVSQGFSFLALTDDPYLQKKNAEIYSKESTPKGVVAITNFESKPASSKIRIGYFSSDFHNHATAHLMSGLFECHDKSIFEIFAFSFGPITDDEYRNRLKPCFERFEEVGELSDIEVANLARLLKIDIAIDLKGYTQDQRSQIFANRAAPIQISYLGYPGTMGASFMDYIIADKIVIPDEDKSHYSEKVVYLPGTYQVNDARRVISEKKYSRTELGLPQNGFVYCCFNNNYKITPRVMDLWCNILHQVSGSVLWLLSSNSASKENLLLEANKRGIDSARIIFAEKLPLGEHLSRHRCADLFLDTLIYNAHTTASDALWSGLPVLTCIGKSFASRVAASLLNAIELPELVTKDEADYTALAIELATNPSKLKVIKEKLERNRTSTLLFDTPLFTKHIETAYTKIYDRYRADLPPDHIKLEI